MTLVLNLLRHGHASPSSPHGDAGRPLSEAGARAVRELAARLAGEGWRPDRVFTSPLVRARETARLLIQGLGVEPPVATLSELDVDVDPVSLLEALGALEVRSGEVLLVGHQPQLGRLAGYLAGGETDLAPGQLVRIRCPEGPARGRGRIAGQHLAKDA